MNFQYNDSVIIYEEFDYSNDNGDLFEVIVQREDPEFVTIDVIRYDKNEVNSHRYEQVLPCYNERNSSLGNAKDTFSKLLSKNPYILEL